MAERYQAPRGTRDLLPGECERWQWAEARAREVLGRYGYREIRTPLFEDYELFARTSGESSEVVQKEMYRFRDLKGRELALRPEGTASVCRAYLERGLGGQGRVHRLWYSGPMFRYGRPQKGRFRQFWQVGAEIIGSASPQADVEAIALFMDLYGAWGLGGLHVRVNSLGTPATRRDYGARLREWLAPVLDRLSEESRQRLETNPLRVLDAKDPAEQAILAGREGNLPPMPRLLDCLDEESRAHWQAVLRGLENLGIGYEVDHGLVRGLDYYTRTAFEVHDASLGAQSQLGGGGRYDGLIEALGGPPTPAVGFSIGLDRTLMVLEARGLGARAPASAVFVVAMDATRDEAARLVRELRREFAADWDLEARGLGAQMKAADRVGATLVVLLGEEEWKRGEVVLKDLKTGTQRTVARARLTETLRHTLAGREETHTR